MFYINYEECKYIKGAYAPLYSSGFILTMRNVNNSGIVDLGNGLYSFILTMRNVNKCD